MKLYNIIPLLTNEKNTQCSEILAQAYRARQMHNPRLNPRLLNPKVSGHRRQDRTVAGKRRSVQGAARSAAVSGVFDLSPTLTQFFPLTQMLVRDEKSEEWVTVNQWRLNIDKNNLSKNLALL